MASGPWLVKERGLCQHRAWGKGKEKGEEAGRQHKQSVWNLSPRLHRVMGPGSEGRCRAGGQQAARATGTLEKAGTADTEEADLHCGWSLRTCSILT